MLLAGKIVLITSASQGIGAGAAIACARHGADVAINDRSADAAAEQGGRGHPRARPPRAPWSAGVGLFTCINDTLFPQAGPAVVQVLDRLGCQVGLDARQTFRGQMHHNSGYSREAVWLVRRFVDIYPACGGSVDSRTSGSAIGRARKPAAHLPVGSVCTRGHQIRAGRGASAVRANSTSCSFRIWLRVRKSNHGRPARSPRGPASRYILHTSKFSVYGLS